MKPIANILFRSWSSVIIPAVLLLISILLFEATQWDDTVQNWFYLGNGKWIFEFQKYHGWGLFYYTLPKFLLGIFATIVFAHGIWHSRKRHLISWWHIYVLACMLAIPGMVGILKARSNMPYPRHLVQYGGVCQKHSLREAYRMPRARNAKQYKGWPGGHASGGFAIFGLAFVFASRKKRWLGFLAATLLGFFMGLGHTMDGNHFISHTIVSYFIAWTVAALLHKLFLHFLHKNPENNLD